MASMPALVKKLPQEGDIRAASMLQQHLSTSSIDASAARVHQQHQSFPGNDERMSVLHQDLGGIGKSIPSALEISLGLRPREISRISGNLLGVGDGFPNTSLVLVEHEYNAAVIFRAKRMSSCAAI